MIVKWGKNVTHFLFLSQSFNSMGKTKANSSIEAARSHKSMLQAIRKREDETLSSMKDWTPHSLVGSRTASKELISTSNEARLLFFPINHCNQDHSQRNFFHKLYFGPKSSSALPVRQDFFSINVIRTILKEISSSNLIFWAQELIK